MVYMTTRVFVSLNQTYVPLYLQVSLQLPRLYVATIPLIMFVAGFVTSSMMKFVNRKMGHKATFLLGCGLGTVLRFCWMSQMSGNANLYSNNHMFIRLWEQPLGFLWLQN